MEGGENHNFDLESALRELAAKREAEGLFTCSAGLKLQQCTVLLYVLISNGTQPATADHVLCTTVLQAAAMPLGCRLDCELLCAAASG